MSSVMQIDVKGSNDHLNVEDDEEPNLQSMGLEESEDDDILNDDFESVTEIESQNVEENLDDLQALISDTVSKWLL